MALQYAAPMMAPAPFLVPSQGHQSTVVWCAAPYFAAMPLPMPAGDSRHIAGVAMSSSGSNFLRGSDSASGTGSRQQESDRLEKMTPRYAHLLEGSGTEHVRLVSLGCMCGPKLSFQQLGRGAETLPFDWVRSRLEGILHFMRSNFEGFYDYQTVRDCAGMTMYRSKYHSFFHDNPDDEGMRQRYSRRIDRFMHPDANSEPVLFVRAVASTNELRLVAELFAELVLRFGHTAHLLIILDYQTRMQGPAVVHSMTQNVLLYFHDKADREPMFAPYIKPVHEALLWAAGKPVKVKEFENLEAAVAATDPTNWGHIAHADIAAFEEQPGTGMMTPSKPAPSIIASSAPQMPSGNFNLPVSHALQNSSSAAATLMSSASAVRASSVRQPAVMPDSSVKQQKQTAVSGLYQCPTAYSRQSSVNAYVPIFDHMPCYATAVPALVSAQSVR